MPNPVAEMLRKAARLNLDDPTRRGSVVHLDEGLDMIVTGDLHGHRSNLTKIIHGANLKADSSRRLVLQEIIHGPQDAGSGQDRSIEVLLRAVRLKLEYPEQVIFLLGNHDIAEVTGNEITRGGQPSCRSFAEGVQFAYRDAAPEIMDALHEFLTSMALAARCAGRVMISHSLPRTGSDIEACAEVLDRAYTLSDFVRGQPVYQWVWGRKYTQEHLDDLASDLDIGMFIIGHHHPPEGFEWLGDQVVSLSCDHTKACVMRFDSGEAMDAATAQDRIISISALA